MRREPGAGPLKWDSRPGVSHGSVSYGSRLPALAGGNAATLLTSPRGRVLSERRFRRRVSRGRRQLFSFHFNFLLDMAGSFVYLSLTSAGVHGAAPDDTGCRCAV